MWFIYGAFYSRENMVYSIAGLTMDPTCYFYNIDFQSFYSCIAFGKLYHIRSQDVIYKLYSIAPVAPFHLGLFSTCSLDL